MGVLDQVMQMKSQGSSNEDIINSLRQQGASPREINDALSQAEIKNAVSGDEPMPETNQDYVPQEQPPMEDGKYYQQPMEMEDPYQQGQDYSPQTQGTYEGYSSMAASTNTMIEVAEQVFSEKMQKVDIQLENLMEFKILAQGKINDIDNRLKKIEKTIDKLQIEILDKVGSYGRNLDGIKKEMSMMQDSFGKMVNPLADLAERKRHVLRAESSHTTHKPKRTRKSPSGKKV